MANVSDKIRFLKKYRENPGKYLPMTDQAWKQYKKVDYGENWYDDPWYNLGWDAGLLDGTRPYFMIGWATCGITILTYHVSAEGIGEYGDGELLAMLEKAKLVKVLDPAHPRTQTMKYTDDGGNAFFSVNITAGDEEGTYVSGGMMYSFSALNKLNRENKKQYEYMVCRDCDPPSLIRLGSLDTMEADIFTYPGVWESRPHLNDIRIGKGPFMDYDSITEEEAMEIMKRKQEAYDRESKIRIYLDMDGVLADFEKGVQDLCHMEPLSQNGKRNDPEKDDLMWERIRKTDHFYDRLDLMPGAKEMFDLLRKKYGDRCEILTGIPREERGIVTAEEDKRNWIRRMLSETVKVNAVCRKHKQNYCTGPESILIDDREKTIREWKELGGTGILFVNTEETVRELKRQGVL